MWDTAGSERFRTIPLSYYHLADGILLLFDVTSQYRFDGIPEWITFIKTHLNGTANKNNPIIYLIVKQFDIDYYEVSSKLNLNIMEFMTKMLNQIVLKKGIIHTKIKLINNRKSIKKKYLRNNCV